MQSLVEIVEREASLLEPAQLKERFELLDRLDALFGGEDAQASVPFAVDPATWHRLKLLRRRVEAMNEALCRSIRAEIQQGSRPSLFSQCLQSDANPADGLSYDYLDDLIGGVLQFQEFVAPTAHTSGEMVFYQPTPVRHIFHLLRLISLSATDVFVDLGSGLGHASLLVSICSLARCIGIEIEEAYIACARRCAQNLNLERAIFIHRDARMADLSTGTVFYLYTPFTGSILATVLARLQHQAAQRSIRICTFGPCMRSVAEESWLKAVTSLSPGQITVFHSRL